MKTRAPVTVTTSNSGAGGKLPPSPSPVPSPPPPLAVSEDPPLPSSPPTSPSLITTSPHANEGATNGNGKVKKVWETGKSSFLLVAAETLEIFACICGDFLFSVWKKFFHGLFLCTLLNFSTDFVLFSMLHDVSTMFLTNVTNVFLQNFTTCFNVTANTKIVELIMSLNAPNFNYFIIKEWWKYETWG